jgi:glucose-6-phosphate 1-dehydrogenase
LSKLLDSIDAKRGTGGNRVFYLSVPPSLFTTIVHCLGEAGLNRQEENFSRIIIEKPFGHDLESAIVLNREMNRVFRENQIYRIDHYLGKETVQNILVFRFSNGIFEPIWNREYIDHIQITVAETIGVGSRGAYYEEAGALRDMVANHMLQLLSLVAMEPPVDFVADAVRDEKVKVLKAIGPLTSDIPIVRARYGSGWVGGERAKGYLEEEGVPLDSRTETFVSLRMLVDNWRWAGVPFYLRHGKRLPKRVTEVAIQFKRPPAMLFPMAVGGGVPQADTLAFRIQPDEGISLRFISTGPGQALQLRPVTMDFLYGTAFDIDPPEAYERLLLDCLLGDSTLFTRRDEVEAAWSILDPLLQTWRDSYPWDLSTHEAGTWGPVEAEELMARDGRVWRRL